MVLASSVVLLAAVDWSLTRLASNGLRLRVVGVSCVVGLIAARWAVERAPW